MATAEEEEEGEGLVNVSWGERLQRSEPTSGSDWDDTSRRFGLKSSQTRRIRLIYFF